MANLRDDLAAHIRQVDGNNELSPYQLGPAAKDALEAIHRRASTAVGEGA